MLKSLLGASNHLYKGLEWQGEDAWVSHLICIQAELNSQFIHTLI